LVYTVDDPLHKNRPDICAIDRNDFGAMYKWRVQQADSRQGLREVLKLVRKKKPSCTALKSANLWIKLFPTGGKLGAIPEH